MGLFDIVWNIHQEHRLRETRDSIAEHARDGRATGRELDEIRAAVDRMALTNRALWEFVSEQTGLTEDDLAERMHAIDLRDGVVDGRMTEPATSCPSCGRQNRTSRPFCLYCGAAVTSA